VNTGELTPENLQRAIEGVDIVVNSTSLGMSRMTTKRPSLPIAGASLTVFDVVYNPYETRLLREAKAAGAKTINGLECWCGRGNCFRKMDRDKSAGRCDASICAGLVAEK